VQAGKIPALIEPLWDSSAWLPERGIAGQVLHALLGYAERPSAMQLLWFLAVALTLAALTRRIDRAATHGARGARAAALVTLIAMVGTLWAAPPAEAAHAIYTPIVEQGEFAVELRGHHDFDSKAQSDGGEQHKLELEYAPTERWLTEALGEWERDPGGALHATEVGWENVVQLTPQGRYWADLAILAEYAHSLERGVHDAIELGVLGETQIARTVLTVNLLGERHLGTAEQTALEYAMRWRYRWRETLEPGVEVHGELGSVENLGPLSEHSQQVGPSIYGRLRRQGGRGALRYEAAWLLGVTHVSPDQTLRLQLEYEY
jgi:hypothetical protein